MNLYDIAIAKKLSGGGGGGGSSDFSTAQVTVVASGMLAIRLPYIVEEDGIAGIIDNGIGEAGTYTVPMYKNLVAGDVGELSQFTVTTTGSAEFNQEANMIFVTGDCTITIS